jgi:hypothetical protein
MQPACDVIQSHTSPSLQPPTYVSVFLVPEGGQIPVDIEKLHSIGITRVVSPRLLSLPSLVFV